MTTPRCAVMTPRFAGSQRWPSATNASCTANSTGGGDAVLRQCCADHSASLPHDAPAMDTVAPPVCQRDDASRSKNCRKAQVPLQGFCSCTITKPYFFLSSSLCQFNHTHIVARSRIARESEQRECTGQSVRERG
eukprot:1318487-Prymnesium_polylepis.1